MASYQLRLERKRKLKKAILEYKITAKLYWNYTRNKFKRNKLFYEIIINDIHNQLENGAEEIRYYMDNGQILYESMEDEYKKYIDNNTELSYDKLVYTPSIFYDNATAIKLYFDQFDDLKCEVFDKELYPYLSIKTNFKNK